MEPARGMSISLGKGIEQLSMHPVKAVGIVSPELPASFGRKRADQLIQSFVPTAVGGREQEDRPVPTEHHPVFAKDVEHRLDIGSKVCRVPVSMICFCHQPADFTLYIRKGSQLFQLLSPGMKMRCLMSGLLA